MVARSLALLVLAAASAALSGCLAIGPYATVKVIEQFEGVTGIQLDPTPIPMQPAVPRLGEVPAQMPSSAPAPTGQATGGPASSPDPAGPGPAAEPGRITLAQFNSVQNGMTYEQVVAIFGRDGQLLPNSRITAYVWSNANGSLARLIFSGNRVADKEQQRLS